MVRLLVFTHFVGFALAFPSLVSAQSKPQLFDSETTEAKMEFLRNLRRRGHSDLAKEFIERLQKNATKEELPLLDLEMARTSVAMAKEQSPGKRMELLDKARAAFEPFIKANPNSPAGAQARLEMAKLYALQGSMALNKALANDDPDLKEKGTLVARGYYDAADNEYAAGIKVLSALKSGSSDQVQAEFERALNYLEKANTYINTADAAANRQRAETVELARKIFAEFAKDTTSANGLMANAYLVKCYQEGQDPPKVIEHYAVVRDSTSRQATPALRLAKYYLVLNTYQDQSVKGDKVAEKIVRVSKWLEEFPTAKKTFEGEHLRFEQALGYITVVDGATKGFKLDEYKKLPAKDKTGVDTNLKNADKIANELAKENGDFSERGNYLHRELQTLQQRFNPKTTVDFEGMLFAAESKFQEATKAKEGPDQAKLFGEGQTLLRSAIDQGEKENVAPSKLHDAHFLLAAAYGGVNDRHRAAIVYESLARANPPSKKGAEAAARAIEIYRRFADEDRDTTAREALHDLAEFVLSPAMLKLWTGEPVVGFTRYNLAVDLIAEEKFPAALEQLEQIPKEFPAYVYSQGQAMFVCLSAQKNEEDPEAKKRWTLKAKEFCNRMGSLPPAADGSTTLMWFTAKMKYPEFLYIEGAGYLRDGKLAEASNAYTEMSKSIAEVQAAFQKDGNKIVADKKDKLAFAIKVLNKYTLLGAADVEYRKGNYARLFDDDMLGGVIKELIETQPKDPKADIQVVDVKVVGESLSLVLRAFVQLGKLDEAKGAYNLLMRIKAADGEKQDNSNFTRALIADLANQVSDMKDRNETAKLKEMVAKFTPFGDALAKNLIFDSKKPDLRDVKNLIRFYESLDQHKKAAELVKVIAEPKFLNQKNLKATEDQDKELFIYWEFQIEKGRLLRLSKDFEGANKQLNTIINHENARAQTLAKIEQIRIYEDKESYGSAIKLWKAFMDDIQRAGIGQNKRLQELYFDAYYNNALCFYKLSQKADTIKAGKSDVYLKTAANLIVRLQNSNQNLGWGIVGPKFQQYMAREPVLKKAYDDAQRAAK